MLDIYYASLQRIPGEKSCNKTNFAKKMETLKPGKQKIAVQKLEDNEIMRDKG